MKLIALGLAVMLSFGSALYTDSTPAVEASPTITVIAPGDSATINVDWDAVVDPAGGSIEYDWQTRDPLGNVVHSGTTAGLAVSFDVERTFQDETWSFCISTRRVEDGQATAMDCQFTYVVPGKAAGPPPAVDSVRIEVLANSGESMRVDSLEVQLG